MKALLTCLEYRFGITKRKQKEKKYLRQASDNTKKKKKIMPKARFFFCMYREYIM